jgi:uncharacterized protein YdhG (YjbR/CyaY superfamily)
VATSALGQCATWRRGGGKCVLPLKADIRQGEFSFFSSQRWRSVVADVWVRSANLQSWIAVTAPFILGLLVHHTTPKGPQFYIAHQNVCARQIRKIGNMKKAKDVDEYITSAPKELQGKLRELRAIIKWAAPKAEERISYGMPYYAYKGRLVYFRHSKNHIGLYVPSPIIDKHKSELEDYETATATVRFHFDKKLPVSLIKKLVKARVKWNGSQKET